jgi:hypothetical protein
MGMAFTDVLLREHPACTVAIVDRRHRPGGHWHDASSYSRLHSTSAYYGVSSRPFPSRKKVEDLPESEKWERPSRDEIIAYYDDVMQDFKQMKSRVMYYPMCNWDNDKKQITSILSDSFTVPVLVKCKVVNTTMLSAATIPSSVSRGKPQFHVEPGVQCVPANELPRVMAPHSKYVVLGSGRKGMEAVLWLLSMGVNPSMLQWVVPRDMWCFHREAMMPDQFAETIATFHSVIKKAASCTDVMRELQFQGILCRIHDDIGSPFYSAGTHPPPRNFMEEAMAFHGWQVSKDELQNLRQVKDIIRQGHVKEIHAERMVLEGGVVPEAQDVLYIDCTSSLHRDPPPLVPIWTEKTINMQMITEVYNGAGDFNPCLAASLTGFLEAKFPDSDEWKNSACTPAKTVDTVLDWWKSQSATTERFGNLANERVVRSWLVGTRPSQWNCMKPAHLRKLSQLDSTVIQVHFKRFIEEVESSKASCLEATRDMSRQSTSASDGAASTFSTGTTDSLDEISGFFAA